MKSKPILLATDGSPVAGEAKREAFELAKSLDAPLLVETVWNVSCTPYGPVPSGAILAFDDVEDEAQRVLESVGLEAKELGLDVETVLVRGIPAEEICRVARERDVQMIVMGSHGWGPMRRFLFGSVSSGVLHDAPCAVLISRPSEEELRAAEEAKVEKREAVPA